MIIGLYGSSKTNFGICPKNYRIHSRHLFNYLVLTTKRDKNRSTLKQEKEKKEKVFFIAVKL